MGIYPLLCQQGNGHARVDHYEAFSGLAPGLITPRDLPRSNADGDVRFMLLLLSFSWLRLQFGRLEPARRHTYLLDDWDVRRPKQGAWWVGYWSLWCGRWWHNNQCGHYMQDIVINLLSYRYYSVLGSCRIIVHGLLLILHCLPGALACKPFSQACHHRGELVQPGL